MSSTSHHFNPQVYLRRFTNPKVKNELWEYNLTTGEVKKSTPKDCGCEDYYHSFMRKDGVRDDESLEKAFRSVENRLPKLFEAVRNKRQISTPIKANLMVFAALLLSRNPKTLHSLQIFNPAKNRDAILGGALSMSCMGELQQRLGRMGWCFLCAPDSKHFFTSDDPVCCMSDKCELLGWDGPGNKQVEITFPLTKTICAFAHWKTAFTQSYIPLPADEVNIINRRTVQNGYRFIYGPTNDGHISDAVEKLAKIKQARQSSA